MKLFLRFSVCYLLFAIIVQSMVNESSVSFLTTVNENTLLFVRILGSAIYLPVIGLPLIAYMIGWKNLVRRAPNIIAAVAGVVVFHAAFTLMKTSLPFILPYSADPFFANIDRALHFGNDAWTFVHQFERYLDADKISYFYFTIWAVPALTFPVIIAVIDGNSARRNRFLILFVLVWVAIGNVLALAGMSAGPVYYDRIFGGERFAELALTLESSGISNSMLGRTQEHLWSIYSGKKQIYGSGISAFPSVHLGTATLIALYLFERNRYLMPIGLIFVAAVLFCSVYSGFHYAIDGYVSILLVVAAWAWLRRRAPMDEKQELSFPATA